MLTIWGRPNSVNVQKVLWAADELGLTYEHKVVGGPHGGNDTPEYRKLNPTGLVPTLVDDGYVIWESNAVVRYLAAQYGPGRLWPTDPRERGLADRWMDWFGSALGGPMTVLFWQHVRTPAEKRDPAAIQKAEAEVAPRWALLDRHLSENEFVGGKTLTMGDIPVGAMAWRWFNLPLSRPDLPNLKRWADALAKRPAYAKWIAKPMS